MALWQRICRLSSYSSQRRSLVSAMSDHRPPPASNYFIRSFAAPIMPTVKPKVAEASKETRLNQDISARFVRLVTDEGHRVVSIREALDCAARLKLDLVEVQRASDPPVCKIMDFHKEKYIQESKEKERKKLQTKIRSGENKEVRFKSKTELKDLKIKADGIIRLLERGYRVKCMAVPNNPPSGQKDSNQKKKKEEDFEQKTKREDEQRKKKEDELRSQLSRLLVLIEDVAIVESGPHVVEKQAYVIVRHNKFRPKKAGKKSPKPADAVSKSEVNSASLQPEEEWESVECVSEADEKEETSYENEEEFHKFSTEAGTYPEEDLNRRTGLEPSDVNKSKSLHPNITSTSVQPDGFSVPTATPVVETNRYSKQKDTRDRYSPATPQSQFHPTHGKFNPGISNSPPPTNGQFGPRHGQFNPSNPSSPSPRHGQFVPRHGQFNSGNPSSPSQSHDQFGPRNPQFNPANPSFPSPSNGQFGARNAQYNASNPSPSNGQFGSRHAQFNHNHPSSSPSDGRYGPRNPQFNPSNPSPSNGQFGQRHAQFNHSHPSSSPSDGQYGPRNPQFNPSNPSPSNGQFGPRHVQFNPSNPSSPSPSSGPKNVQFNSSNLSPPSSSYGIFSGRDQATGSSSTQKTTRDQNQSGDPTKVSDRNPKPSASYGIFSDSKPMPSDGQKDLRSPTPIFNRTQS